MDSPQSVMSPFKSCAIFTEPEKQNTELFLKNSGGGITARREDLIGLIDVYIHQARDIHNICIYQKQDVYAKLCLTSDPDNALSTKIINGGGKNPVFNENLRLNVRTMECCVKCEIWMMSRVRNYMEDQLLGFALVPLSEVVLLGNGKLEKEFSLSSTDLFHSPAGFVHLSLSYNGTLPELISISAEKTVQNAEVMLESLANEFEKIEFPDPKIMNENDVMVSEYFGIQGSTLESQSSENSLVSSSENENQPSPDVGESFPSGNMDSPPSSVCVSTNDSHPASSQSSETPGASKTAPEEYISPSSKECAKEKSLDDSRDAESVVFPKAVNIEAEQKVVQQDIIDMYMKSMQQFTESLAKMKLPLELESTTTTSSGASGNSSSDLQKSQTPKSAGSRVFYGSRAFF